MLLVTAIPMINGALSHFAELRSSLSFKSWVAGSRTDDPARLSQQICLAGIYNATRQCSVVIVHHQGQIRCAQLVAKSIIE
jgi:hypothetical protein